MLSLAFGFAEGIGSPDPRLEITGTDIDAAGNTYVSGSFFDSIELDPSTTLTSAGSRDLFLAKYSPSGELLAWEQAGSNRDDRAADLVLDGSGNVYVTGFFSGSVDFGSEVLNAGGADTFVWKLDGDLNPIWAEAANGPDTRVNEGLSIDVDAAGMTVVVSGQFTGPTSFGGTTLTPNDSTFQNGFVARLDGSGNFVAASGFFVGTDSGARAEAVALDPSGNVVVHGGFVGGIDLDPTAASQSTTSTDDSIDAFLVKLSPSGAPIFGTTFGSPLTDLGTDVAAAADGSVFAVGRYVGTVDFDRSAVTAGDTLVGSPNQTGVYVLRLGADGAFGYVADLGSRVSDLSNLTPTARLGRPRVGLDGEDLYVAASFEGTGQFGSIELPSAGSSDVVLARLSSADGTVLEAIRTGGEGVDSAVGLGVDPAGGVAVGGRYVGPAAFGTTTLPDLDVGEAFVTRLGNGPEVLDVLDVTPDPTTGPVDSVDVVFSESLEISSFSPANFRLTRDGVAVPLTGTLSFNFQGNNTYRLAGLSALTGTPGTYVLTVEGSGFVGLDGLVGAGSASDTFTVTGDPGGTGVGPTVTDILDVDPDPRSSPVDSVDVVFSEAIDLATFTVDDLTLTLDGQPVAPDGTVTTSQVGATTYRVSGLNPFTTGQGSYVLTVSGSGVQDTDGNAGTGTAEESFEVDLTGPTIVEIVDVSPDPRAEAVDSVFVNLSEVVDPASFTFEDLALTRNTRPVTLDGRVTVARESGTTYRISGLGPFTGPGGVFVLTVDASGLADPVGNAGTGTAEEKFTVRVREPADYDGDGVSDLAIYHFDTFTGVGRFEIRFANGATRTVPIPQAGPNDIPVEGDFDGDGVADPAIFQPNIDLGNDGFVDVARWVILLSTTGQPFEFDFGGPGGLDRPAPADYDGDGTTDIATFRPSSDLTPGVAEWFVRPSTEGAFRFPFGAANGIDLPAPGDYDGDGRDDIATFRPAPTPEDFVNYDPEMDGINAQWFIVRSADGALRVEFGAAAGVLGPGALSDQPVIDDYDHDGRADIAAFRTDSDLAPGQSDWFILQSSDGARRETFGVAGSIAAPADYDGDGTPDLTVFEPSLRRWTLRLTANGIERTVDDFGTAGRDTVPVLAPLAFRLIATGNPIGPTGFGSRGSAAFLGGDGAPAPGNRAARLSGQADAPWAEVFDLALEGLSDGPDPDGRA